MKRTVRVSRSVRDRAGAIGVDAREVDRLRRVMAPRPAKLVAKRKPAASPKAAKASIDFQGGGLLDLGGLKR